MRGLRDRLDTFWGRGGAVVTAPSMDGAEQSARSGARAAVDARTHNLVACAGEILFSSAEGVFALAGDAAADRPVPKYQFAQPIACLAAHESGRLAVGVSGEIALAFDGPDALIACLGSAANLPQKWKRDLPQRNASGSIWRIDLATGSATRLADGLGYPNGVLVVGRDLRISEAWRHRVLLVKPGAAPTPLLEHLPGYLARITDSADGGSWLCVFAPRRQMVEFVLREVHPDHWMAPTLRSGRSFLEPIRGGAVKHLGVSKPWAPTRSHGLAIRLDVSGSPAEALSHGVAMVFQETSLAPSMTVVRNIYLGDENFFHRRRGRNIAAQQFLQSLKFNVDPWASVAGLGAAKPQMVEIARAVRQQVKIIIFDEPTASPIPEEKHHFFSLIARLKPRGVSISFISPALKEALAILDGTARRANRSRRRRRG